MGEFHVVPGRPHRDREGTPVDPQLHRLLGGEGVRAAGRGPAGGHPHDRMANREPSHRLTVHTQTVSGRSAHGTPKG